MNSDTKLSLSKCAVIDLQNLLKTINQIDPSLSGPNFKSLDDIKNNFIEVVKKIHSHGISYQNMYMVFKSFHFIDTEESKEYSYHEVTKYILCLAHQYFPEWKDPTLIIIESLDKNDKEVDDRALFIICKQLIDLNEPVVIFSNDHFLNIATYLHKPAKCTYYTLFYVDHENWIKSKMIVQKEFTDILSSGHYTVIHLSPNHTSGFKLINF